jgi:enterochelin esterase-like enzyme
MNKRSRLLALYSLFLFLALGLQAQDAKVLTDVSHKSKVLKKEKLFSIYLPAGYETSGTSYPVVYLLHGAGSGVDGNNDWIKAGNMKSITDQAIATGKIKPMVIVMPDAEMTYYMNNVDGDYQYEDYFMKELLPYIEKHYNVKKNKENRGIAGLSMGGFGALLYGLHHPDQFSAVAALSSGLRTDEQIRALPLDGFLRRYGSAMGNVKEGEERITSFWDVNSIDYLIENIPAAQKTTVRFYLDIGDKDYFQKTNAHLHMLMIERGVPHEYKVRDGAHNWGYWRTGLTDALDFISAGF